MTLETKTVPNTLSQKAWIVCLSAALFFFYEFIQMHMFNAINDALRVSFDVNATEFGFLSSTYLWGDTLFLLPAGMLLDRFSTRSILLIALAVCIIGTLGFSQTDSFYAGAFFHCISGCGNAFCFLACILLVSRWFPPNRQAFVVGIVITMAFLGGVMAQTPLAWLTEQVGWRMALVYDSILGAIFLLIIFFNVKDFPDNYIDTSKHEKQTSFIAGFKQAIANVQNVLAGIYTCFLNLPIMVLDAIWGVTYLKVNYGLSTIQASNVASMIFFGSMIACPLVGFISDRVGLRKMPMIIGAIASLFITYLVVFVPGWSYWSLLVLFFVMGFVTSTQIIAYPFAAESNVASLTGTAVGLVSFIIIGGAALAQIVFGQLLDMNWNGLMENGQRVYSALAYHRAMLMFPVTMGIGLLASIALRETYCKKVND